jgi:hypothetical protein
MACLRATDIERYHLDPRRGGAQENHCGDGRQEQKVLAGFGSRVYQVRDGRISDTPVLSGMSVAVKDPTRWRRETARFFLKMTATQKAKLKTRLAGLRPGGKWSRPVACFQMVPSGCTCIFASALIAALADSKLISIRSKQPYCLNALENI